MPAKILCIVGTRPEVIKMAPAVRALRARARFAVTVLCSGQHRDLLKPLADWFDLDFDDDLAIMTENQSLAALTARLMTAFDDYLRRERWDLIMAQGDTTTVACAALACFYLQIPFAHVEAGLRTFDLANPFPEEFNRWAAGHLARFHFCPSQRAAENLRAERADSATIHVTGNTVIDALRYTVAKLGRTVAPGNGHDILLTAHRRENFGTPLENVFHAVRALCDEYPRLRVLYPVHPNPNVREPAQRLLGGHARITLAEPLSYPELVSAMQQARFILTDSGGIQEEAPALGKPVLVLRSRTERPEVVELGLAQLVGTDSATILAECRRLLDDERHYTAMARGGSPYGDGHAAERIADILEARL
jgi:UDP-N-acetylglucosamine 2-epimerase (non-hydrolysing)